jgi:hypothetical protein
MSTDARAAQDDFDLNRVYADTGRLFVTPNGLAAGRLAGPLPDEDRDALQRVIAWIESDIMRPVKKLDRVEAVCPFAKPAISADRLFLTVAHLDNPADPRQILAELAVCSDIFVRIPVLRARDASLRGMMILYPHTPDPLLNVAMTSALTPRRAARTHYVGRGIMIGEAFPTDPDPSSWDPTFFPDHTTPIPFLLLRNLVETDWRFVRKIPAWRGAFRRHFGTVPDEGLNFVGRLKLRLEELAASRRP